ncbi:protein of unknown function [Tenacibaculum sp. 190524A02b]
MNLYEPLFKILEPNFHTSTIIYVDNANMKEGRDFFKSIPKEKYQITSRNHNKAAIIELIK